MLAGEVLRFGLTGAAASAAHLLAFAALYDGLGAAPVPANALAVLIASSVTYLGQRFWVFRARAGRVGTGQILRFAASLGLVAALHAGVLKLAVAGLGLSPYLGAVLGLVVVPPTSFLINRAWVFRPA